MKNKKTKYETCGSVRGEVNAALEELQRLTRGLISGLVVNYAFSFRDGQGGKDIGRAEADLFHGEKIKIVFEWDYPLISILAVRCSYFMTMEQGIKFMKSLQRMAGPITWTFQAYTEKREEGHFKFCLQGKHLNMLDANAQSIWDFDGKIYAWDDPENPLNWKPGINTGV
jgi:hypothetical protein